MNKASKFKVLVLVLPAFLWFVLQIVQAQGWQEPSAPFPGGNPEPPVDTSNLTQTKSGVFQIGTNNKVQIYDSGTFPIILFNPDSPPSSNGQIFWSSAANRFFVREGATTTALIGVGGGGSSQWTDVASGINYSGGNVGVGVANPNYKLHVNGTVRATTFSTGFSLETGAISETLDFIRSDQNLNIYYNGTGAPNNVLTIKDWGSVVINTPLTVSGALKITSGGPGAGRILTSDASGNATWGPPPAGTGDITGVIAGFGLLGGGTSGDVAIALNTASISSCTNSATNKIYWNSSLARLECGIDTGGAAAAAYWIQSGSSLYASTTSWNVGIGNTAPVYKLDVTGTFRATDISTFSSPVGVGTNAPASRLHIKDGATWGTNLSLDATGVSASGRRWDLVSTAGSASEGVGKFLIKDNNANAVRMTIDSVGNVGIATTSPLYKLTVAGDSAIVGDLRIMGTGNGIIFPDNTIQTTAAIPGGSGGSSFWASSTSPVGAIYYNAGNVGVGTANPSAKLEVVGQVKITGGSPGIGKVLTSDAVGLATWQTPSAGGSSGGPDYWVFTGGNLYSSSTVSRVGIGTNSPRTNFEVLGNIKVSSPVGQSNSLELGSGASDTYSGFTVPYNFIQPPSTDDTCNFDITNPYTCGATQNSSCVDVAKGRYTPPGGSEQDAWFKQNVYCVWPDEPLYKISNQGGTIKFINNTNNARLVIGQDGNTGIGTSTPSYPLHVSGSIGISNLGTTGSIGYGGVGSPLGLTAPNSAFVAINSLAGPTVRTFSIYKNAVLPGLRLLEVNEDGDLRIGNSVSNGVLTGTAELCLGTTGGASGGCISKWGDISSSGSSGGPSYWLQSGNNLYASSSNWNVGIGTTNPSTKLEVYGGDLTLKGPGGSPAIVMGENVSDTEGPWVFVSNISSPPATTRDTCSTDSNRVNQIYSCGSADQKICNDVAPGTNPDGTPAYFERVMTCVLDSNTLRLKNEFGTFKVINTGGTANFILGQDGALNVGAGRFIVNASGNVGIGTSSPIAKLSIDQGATNNLALSLRSTGNGWGSGLQFLNSRNYGIYAGNDNRLHFADVNAGADRILINSNGTVAIGTTASTYKLEVAGDVNIVGVGEFRKNGTAIPISPWNNGLGGTYYNGGNVTIGSGGLGIGITGTSTTPLTFATVTGPKIDFYSKKYGIDLGVGLLRIFADDNKDIIFSDKEASGSYVDHLRIVTDPLAIPSGRKVQFNYDALVYGNLFAGGILGSTGKVGIGTVYPSSSLHIAGSGKYLQLPIISSVPPPAPDCDNVSERGRVVLGDDGGFFHFWICTSVGWQYQ